MVQKGQKKVKNGWEERGRVHGNMESGKYTVPVTLKALKKWQLYTKGKL